MLFGKDDVISSVNPYCRTDALYRVDDLDRYDDRDFVETNLLDMYDRLIDFIAKYTMDRFALDENARRVSPRNVMVREIVLNTLMHRDITDGHTSRVIIYKDKLICENPNSFRTMGLLTVKNYTPFAKNPTIAKFFREIGLADELGSGVKNVNKYLKIYSGREPEFIEGDIFKQILPISEQGETETIHQDTHQDTHQDKMKELRVFCKTPRSRVEMQGFLGLKDKNNFKNNYLIPMLEKGLIEMTIPDKPTSKNQKYVAK